MKPFAAFDIDGTLIRWQLYHAIVDKLAKEGVLGKKAHQQLHEARMIWKRREDPEAFKDYEKSLISIYESHIGQIELNIFDRMVQTVIDEYKDQIYTYTRDLAKSLKQKGYALLAISGSHHELIEQLARYYEFDDWMGTRYERLGQKFSGAKSVPSSDKRKGLLKMVEKNKLSYEGSLAIGDSLGDAPMLQLVEQPIAFNPDRSLFDMAKSNGWKVVIERKNMIYQLEPKDDTYILA